MSAWQAAEEYNYRYHAILSAVPLCAFVTLRSVVSVRVGRVVRVMSHVVLVCGSPQDSDKASRQD